MARPPARTSELRAQNARKLFSAARTASGLSSCRVWTARGISTNLPRGSSFAIRSATSRSRTGLPSPRRTSVGGVMAELRADVDDDQLLHEARPLGGEVHRVPAAHREPDEDERPQAQLVDDAGDVVEGRDGVVGVGGIAVAVTPRVEGVDVKVG